MFHPNCKCAQNILSKILLTKCLFEEISIKSEKKRQSTPTGYIQRAQKRDFDRSREMCKGVTKMCTTYVSTITEFTWMKKWASFITDIPRMCNQNINVKGQRAEEKQNTVSRWLVFK